MIYPRTIQEDYVPTSKNVPRSLSSSRHLHLFANLMRLLLYYSIRCNLRLSHLYQDNKLASLQIIFRMKRGIYMSRRHCFSQFLVGTLAFLFIWSVILRTKELADTGKAMPQKCENHFHGISPYMVIDIYCTYTGFN